MSASRRIVTDGLFTIDDDDRVRLIGTLCTSCGNRYFPASPSCRNPDCVGKEVEPTELGERGTLYSWTVQDYRPPAPFRMDDWRPYPIGLVDVGDGLRVIGIVDVAENALAVDMPLRLASRRLFGDEEGRDVLTYCFVADTAGAAR